MKMQNLICLALLILLVACGEPENSERRAPSESAEQLEIESEEVDADGTQRLQEQLMNSMRQVAEKQDDLANDTISSDFDNASEQHRQAFIDETLLETEAANEGEAENLAEKLENIKEIEHAPLEADD